MKVAALVCLFASGCGTGPADYRDALRSFSDDSSESPVCDAPSSGSDDCEPDNSTDTLFSVSQSREIFVGSVTRKGDPSVTVPFLFYAPAQPSAAVVLFTGSNGLLKLSKNGVGKAATNFVVRTRHLYAAAGFCTVLVDAPSDHPHGLGNGYRTGGTEAKDLAPVLDYVDAHCPNAPIWLVGTSRGTISAANVAARLDPSRIAGVLSTSSITVDPHAGTSQPEMATLYDVPLKTIVQPVQLMHHHDDGCSASPFDGAPGDRYTGVDALLTHFAAARTTLLSPVNTPVTGADGAPCGPVSYHGYWHLDDGVVPALVSFIQSE